MAIRKKLDLLGLPNWRLFGITRHADFYSMQVESIQAISEENCCSEPKLQRNSHDNILYRDLPIFALPTHIHFKKVRFICSHCKKRSLEKRSDNVAEKHLMTRRLVQHIVDQSLRRPFSSVAREVDLDETTVQDVFMGAAEDRLKSRKIPCPVYMGIDDKHLILTVKSPKNEHNEAEKNNNKATDYYYTVITNLENRTAYEIIKGRDSDTVTSYLRELPDRGNVKVICHDLADSYQKVSKALSETAIGVVDKYHIIALLQDAVNEARKKESRRLEVGEEAEREKEIKEVGLAKTPKYEGLEANAKKDYRLIRAPRKTLPQSARERVDAYLSLMPELKKVHRLRDDFMLLYKAKSPASAAKALERWEKNALTADSVYLQKFLTELKSCRELFLNYFISDVRAHLSSREEHMRDVSTQPKEIERSDPISGAVTNGYAEGLNRQINYLVFISPNISFRVLRLKILLLHGGACDEEREGRPLELARKSFRKSEQRKKILALSWSR